MKFFNTIRDSIYNPSFYKSLTDTPTKKSVGFYFKFIAIVAFIASLFVIPALLMLARPETYSKILDAYPRELEVTIKNGKATTNVTEPYFIKNKTGEGPENILVIDTKTDFSLSQFDEYKTLAVLKSDNLAVQGEKKQDVRIMRLSTVGDITISYALIESWLAKFQSLAKYILPVIFVLMVIMFYVVNIFKLVYLFLAALVVWVIARVLKKNIGYKKSYQISLHAIVLPMLLQLVAMLFGVVFPAFLFSFIVLFIAAINMHELPNISDTPTEKGFFTIKSVIIGLVVIIILALVLIFMPRSTVRPVDTDNGTATTTATTTPQTSGTATSTATSTVTIKPNSKTFAHATLGLAFNYPNDFLVRKEGFSTNGSWSALLVADRGDISVSVVKGSIQSRDIKLQTTSIKIGGKDAILYNTRRDNGCDATIAETTLDAEYSLQFTFLACGDKLGSIFKNRDDINATLASVSFSNENSRLIVETKRNFAFRYPLEWSKAVFTTTNSLTKITFGSDAEIQAGAQYSPTLKRNLTFTEVVTGALTTPNTIRQEMTIAGKNAVMLTTTPTTGNKKRTVYMANTSPTDLIIITHTGVDADGLNLILNSFTLLQ